VLIGKTAEKIRGLILTKKSVQKAPSVTKSNTFKEAFQQATTYAEKGDVVLLSPACASYDMFINYEERGRQFKEMVKAL
jgi:UDP-N-acetylmuramoylalanine--D-glutamate ligase